MKSRHVLGVALLLVVSQTAGCGLLPKEEEFQMAPVVQEYEGETFNKVTVKRGDVMDATKITCTYEQSNRQDLSFNEDDTIIEKVFFKQGDKVKEGDVIAQLQVDSLDEELENQDYQIAQLEMQNKQSEEMKAAQIEKQKSVFNDKKAIEAIESQFDTQITANKNQLKILKMQREETAEQKLDYALVAEMDGKISFLEPGLEGSSSLSGTIVCTITDNSKPKFVAETDQIDKFKSGETVPVTVNDMEYETTVKIPKDLDETVYLILQSTPNGLLDEAKGDVLLVKQASRDVLYLPSAAVTTMDGKAIVYQEDENGIKVPKEIQAGLTASNRTEIVSGLNMGDEVIVN